MPPIYICSDNHTYTMQLTNETALPVAWIEAEYDNWGCDEEDCDEDNSAWNECDNYYWETRHSIIEDDGWGLGPEDISAVVTECYEDNEVDPNEWGTDNYEFPERKVETFMDVSGFVFDKYNSSTYEVQCTIY